MTELRCFVFVLLQGVVQDVANSFSKVSHNSLCALMLELSDYWYELIKNVHLTLKEQCSALRISGAGRESSFVA